ncbi:probable fucosyltransferase 8 [Phragmites australis]|uniref:probable fucosyltransferase 8 n=1 Tax=Phragmites australis TaxID=29695 RepID=UPI002D7A1A15|nr:probable fucosyltransferase 8 [Phragmites australis]
MKMGGAGGVRELDGPVATAGTPGREKSKERRGRAGAVLLVCLMSLPFLAILLHGRESAATVWRSAGAKLSAAMSEGCMNASHASTSTTGATTKADELLGGLLAPGFDRRACLSRYQSAQYYKYFPYAPSPYLLHKLRAYEARHKKCAPGTPLYAKSVAQLRSGRSTEAMECNYLVWLPYEGLGNRMLSMLSGFVYALLTDRVLLVDLPQDSTDLFCEPFPDTTWVLPPDFPVANLFRLGVNPDQSYRNLLGKKKIVKDPANATVQSVPPYVYLSLAHNIEFMDNLFFCSDDQLVLAKVNWLLLFSDLYFVPSLYSMAEFRGELQRLFPAKESVSHLLARYLFHPSNTVWGLVTRYYHSYLAQASQRIGVQIRIFPFSTIPVDDMYNQILACSRQEHILPEIDGDEAAVTGNLSTTNGDNGAAAAGSKAILVASLYADYYERIRSTYYEHAAKGGVRVGVFQPSHEERQATGKLEHNQKALTEIYLLSFSEVLLTSGMSTFGYMSSSLAGLRPTVLHTAFHHKVPKTPCMRAVSMEPCNLTPPSVKCQGTAVDKDLARHVNNCEDDHRGIKLFD